MSKQTVYLGQTADGTNLKAAEVAVNANFSEIYVEPIRFSRSSVTAVTNVDPRVISRAGTYARALATLSAALTGASTVVVKKNGTAVATITIASGATVGTVAWAVGSSFSVVAGDILNFTTTVGTGTADLSVVLDAAAS